MTPAQGESSSAGTQMLTALVRLHGAVSAVTLPLEVPGVEAQREVRRELVEQLEDYLIPRMTSLEAPMLVVVGGSTGAGKSTLVNTLVGHKVTQPGVLRPTTRSPVLVHHPDDAAWFGQDRLLPDLERVTHTTDRPDALQLVATDAIPSGLAILDAPDVDSVEERNRLLAAQLLAAADLWLFVTSAARYADQVPWEYLTQAAQRDTAVAVVLDRTAPEAVKTVEAHLARMLASRGLKDSPLFVVHEGPVSDEGLLPAGHVADIRGWFESLAHHASARADVVDQTVQGSVRSLSRRVHPVADAAAAQQRALEQLRGEAVAAYDRAVEGVRTACGDGTLLRGEVLARWQEFVGTGDLLRSLEDKVGWLRDRLVNAVKGKPQQAERVAVAIESGVEALLLEQAEAAAGRVADAWSKHEPGAAVLSGPGDGLARASRDLRRRTEQSVRSWQQDVVELVRLEGADKRTARFLAYGVHGLSVALMVVTFEHRSGSGASDVGRRLLEAVFGADAVPGLVDRSRETLEHRLADLVEGERARCLAVLDALGIDAGAAEQLRTASRRVDDVRFAAVPRVPAAEAAEDTP